MKISCKRSSLYIHKIKNKKGYNTSNNTIYKYEEILWNNKNNQLQLKTKKGHIIILNRDFIIMELTPRIMMFSLTTSEFKPTLLQIF